MAKQFRNNQTDVNTVAKLAALEGKMPPQSLEFEEAVLGALLLEREAFQEVVEILEPQHFYSEQNQRIYNAMLSLNAAMKPIDMLTVIAELDAHDELELAGGRMYIIKLTQKVTSAVNVDYHARIIFQKYVQRALIHLGVQMQNNAYDDARDVEDILEEAENELFTLSQGTLKKDVMQVAPIITTAIEQMKLAATKGDVSGLPSGFVGIDRVTSGWQPATLIVIAARPAMGKTAFVLSMARNMAVKHKASVAIFSLEMSNTELVKRLLVAETEIKMEKIKNGNLTPEEWAHFNQSMPALAEAKLFIDDTPGLSIFDLRSKARMLKKKYNVDCIIIDYLQLMTAAATKPGSRQEEVANISRSLKGLAKELNIPVIALSQLNRNVEGRVGATKGGDSNRPQLSDLRESGAIEQDADMVCFIHRPEYYRIYEDAKGNDLHGKAFFIIAKHRSGAVEDVLLNFQAELVRFEDSLEGLQNADSQEVGGQRHIISSSLNAQPAAEGGGVLTESLPSDMGAVPDLTPQTDGSVPF